MPKKVGIFGGTFDPIHYAHLLMANFAIESANLDEVRFVPNGNPPHKSVNGVTDKFYRYKMVELAIENNPMFSISDYEINKEERCYSVDLIEHFKKNENATFYFIIGADSFYQIKSWHRFETLVKMCSLIVLNRHYKKKDSLHGDILKFEKEYSADIIYADMPFIDISSTFLRQRIARGKSIEYLTCKKVENFINKHNLYREKED